ncbi:MAG: lysophospholipase [Promethearchaeota archaeon]
MKESTFTYSDHTGVEIFVYKWEPEGGAKPKAVVQILHGMAEHAARYSHVAKALVDAGYLVYAEDHHGHGRSAIDLEHAGVLGEGGWEGTLLSIKELSDQIKKENPNLPLFLLGHSWGSYLGQDYIQRWGDTLQGVILSGTNGKQAQINILLILAKIIVIFKGYNAKAVFIDKLAIKPLNKPFEPSPSPNTWLSRDESVATKYDADPLCGFMMPNSYFIEMAKGFKKIWKSSNEQLIPKTLPLYFLSGSKDSSNLEASGMFALIERYKKLSIADITYKVYEGARHEIYNETNKEEVIKDTIEWLDKHLP